jgi:hypothetical protein
MHTHNVFSVKLTFNSLCLDMLYHTSVYPSSIVNFCVYKFSYSTLQYWTWTHSNVLSCRMQVIQLDSMIQSNLCAAKTLKLPWSSKARIIFWTTWSQYKFRHSIVQWLEPWARKNDLSYHYYFHSSDLLATSSTPDKK